jgi:hypothetical protein
VNSGEVIYQGNLTARSGSYEHISGYCAAGILEHCNIRAAESTERKVEGKREEMEEAVVAFSGAAGRLPGDHRDRQPPFCKQYFPRLCSGRFIDSSQGDIG